jgi:hypothetical protein
MKLYDFAHSRAGDKGNISTLSVIAYEETDYPRLVKCVTVEKIMEHFKVVGITAAERYEIPTLGALNFVLHNTLGGGVTRSLALDTHGKTLSSLMLELEIEEE